MFRLVAWCGVVALGVAMVGVALNRPPMPALQIPAGVRRADVDAAVWHARNIAAARSFDAVTAVNGILLIVLGSVRLVRHLRRPAERDQGIPVTAAVRVAGQTRGRRITLGILVAVAAVLRLPGLGHGLWYDELYTVRHFLSTDWRGIITDWRAPNNHVLYTLVLNAWNTALPADLDRDTRVRAWRLLSVLFGTLAVPAVWLMARGALAERTALMATVWFAVSPLAVDLSQQLRGYALAMTWAAAATALLLHLLRGGRGWPAYIALGIAMLWTHPLSLAVLAGHAAAVWVARRGSLPVVKRFALAALIIAMGAAQVYALVIPDGLRNAREQAGPQTLHTSVTGYLLGVCRAAGPRTGPAWICAPIGLLTIGGAISLARRSRAAGWACGLPPAMLIAAGICWPPLREIRFLPILAPHLAVLLVAGAATLCQSLCRGSRIGIGLTAAAALACAAWGLASAYHLPVQALRDALRDAAARDAGRTVVLGLGAHECGFYDPAVLKAPTAAALSDLLATHRISRIIVPYPRTWLERPEQKPVRALLVRSFRLAHTYPGRLPEDPNVHVYLSD